MRDYKNKEKTYKKHCANRDDDGLAEERKSKSMIQHTNSLLTTTSSSLVVEGHRQKPGLARPR
jgi:hypothetical protein